MKRTLATLGMAFLVAVLVWLALPGETNAEKAGNIIVLAFFGAAIVTWLMWGAGRGGGREGR